MLAGATSLEYLRLFKVHVCVPVKEHFEHVNQLVANKILSCANLWRVVVGTREV